MFFTINSGQTHKQTRKEKLSFKCNYATSKPFIWKFLEKFNENQAYTVGLDEMHRYSFLVTSTCCENIVRRIADRRA